MGVCYIVGAGDSVKLPEIKDGDLLIAADGGYDELMRQSLVPDLLIGDLDSIKEIPGDVEILRHKVRKDETDMHLAYLYGAERGYKDFFITGGTGGRADHTFANYCLLLYIREQGGFARLASREYDAYVIRNESFTFSGSEGKHFSVFAFAGNARGVSIKGSSYEADGANLEPSFPLGVSNAFLDTPVTVEVKEGALLLILEK